jgi:4-aminobutyrate aminotransferase
MPNEQPFGTLLPKIVTAVPGPKSAEYAERIAKVESPAANTVQKGEVPIFWERTGGANIQDVDGNIYVDLISGFCVASTGHSNPRIVEAIYEQAKKCLHSQGVANPTPVRVQLLEKIAQLAPGDLKVSHIVSGGAEAVESCYKTARLYTGKPGFAAFHGAFHGKTGSALSLTARDYYRKPFLPLMPAVIHVPFANCYRCPIGHEYPGCNLACAKYLEYILDDPDSGCPPLAGMIMEPIQGHGGWVVPPREWVQEVRRLTKERGILLVFDEIITGFGRTGNWFAAQTFGVTPDIMAVGKSMASGFPISAMVTTREIASKWGSAQHSSTFTGHPVGCAAALASIADLEEKNLVQRSRELGAYFKDALQQVQKGHPIIGDVRGVGMMVAVELVKDRKTKTPASDEAKRVLEKCHNRGVFVNNLGGTYHNVFKFTPPLVITREQLDFAIKVFDEAIGAVEEELAL